MPIPVKNHLDLSGNKIQNLGDATLATDAVNKGQLDAAVAAAGVKKFSATIGDGAATIYTVTHNLNTKDVLVSVRQVSDDIEIMCEVDHDTLNTIVVRFATAPANASLRVVVVG